MKLAKCHSGRTDADHFRSRQILVEGPAGRSEMVAIPISERPQRAHKMLVPRNPVWSRYWTLESA